MKTNKLIFIITLTLITTLLFSGCSQEDNEVTKIKDAGVLKVGCRADVVGFGYFNPETNEYEGLEVEIAYEIAAEIFDCSIEKAKSKVEFTPVNDSTRGIYLNDDTVDVVLATFTITEERKTKWNFSTPYYSDYVGFLVRADSNILTSQDLIGKIIGLPSTSTTREAVDAYLLETNINATIQEFDTFLEIKEALVSHEIDAFSLDRSVLASYVDENTVFLEDRFAEQKFGAATKLENTALADVVESVIKEMVQTYNLQ